MSEQETNISLLLEIVKTNTQATADTAADMQHVRETLNEQQADMKALIDRCDKLILREEFKQQQEAEASKSRQKLIWAFAAAVGGLLSQAGGGAADLLRAFLG